MLGYLKAMLCGHRILKSFQLRREELYDSPTLRADHVIVVLMLVIVFVVGDAIAKANFARESRFGQKFQRAVNGGLTNGRVFLSDKAVKVFAGKMLLRAQKQIKNQVALSRALESLLLDMGEKNFLFFSHWLDESGCAPDVINRTDSTLGRDRCEDADSG